MSDTKTQNPFVVLNASTLRAAMKVVSKDASRPTLQAVHLKGRFCAGTCYVSVAATDSYRMFFAEETVDAEHFGDITDDFEWLMKPNKKLATSAGAVRIERIGEGREGFEVTSYNNRGTLPALNRAAHKFEPAAWDKWDEIDGSFPDWYKLAPKGALNAAAGWCANAPYAADAYKTLAEATGNSTVLFDGMASPDGARVPGALMYSATSDGIDAHYLLMPVRDNGTLVVGAAAKGGEPMVAKKAYDEMCELYRKHALREEELEAEVKRLKESTAAADEHAYSAEHIQHMADEYQAVIDRQHDELMGMHDRINVLEAELARAANWSDEANDGLTERDARIEELEARVEELTANAEKIVPFAPPQGVTVEERGDVIVLDTSNSGAFVVCEKSGNPLLLLTENGENVWLEGATRALRERADGFLAKFNFSWSAKRRAWWAPKTA